QWSCSWATLQVTTEAPYQVRQSGERKLWDEVQTAYRWWLDLDKPAADAWRFTITPSGQRIELSLNDEHSPDPTASRWCRQSWD
ncbi:MAG: hypothetical protein ACRDTE_33490, partial [Pseudonocardiaceae bacterium]